MNILIINGHQKWENFSEGRLNKCIQSLLETLLVSHQVSVSYVDQDYDPVQEVQKWKEADLIIYLFPIFWMSVPWKMKKYLEEVLMKSGGVLFKNDGRSRDNQKDNYGNGGLSHEKKFMMISTMNAPQESFNNNFFDGNFDNLMSWLVKNNHFIGITKQIPSVVFYDVVKNPEIESGLKQLEQTIYKELYGV